MSTMKERTSLPVVQVEEKAWVEPPRLDPMQIIAGDHYFTHHYLDWWMKASHDKSMLAVAFRWACAARCLGLSQHVPYEHRQFSWFPCIPNYNHFISLENPKGLTIFAADIDTSSSDHHRNLESKEVDPKFICILPRHRQSYKEALDQLIDRVQLEYRNRVNMIKERLPNLRDPNDQSINGASF